MALIELLKSSSAAFAAVAALLGLLVGSFLNVVIHRLPIMLEREWKVQCAGLLEVASPEVPRETFNLLIPRSRCPHCGHTLSALENIPILSYLMLRGQCSACGASISIHYPLVEAVCGILSGAVAWHFGFGWEAGAALLLTWGLLCLSVIDINHHLLPDIITLPFLWLGLMLSLCGLFTNSHASILGAACGYLLLWTIYQVFRLVTGKEGMGYGDFKLLGLLGAWMGWQILPMVVLLSSLVGAVVGISRVLFLRHDRRVPIPFGPYLAAAGWIALLWGEALTQAYLRWTNISP
jgi:Type II secretory pathway, prepilin signal peptidase PulO and related peptidases